MKKEASQLVAVYLSFTSFRSAIQSLRSHGLPDQIDRSAFSSRSGGEQGQIISALRFLGLIDDDGKTQEALRKLVASLENSEEEKKLLADLLRTRYEKVFAHDLTKVTPKQLDDAIGEYNATGATRDRAVRFFVKAAKHSGIPLSSRLTVKTRNRSLQTDGGTRPPRRRPRAKSGATATTSDTTAQPSTAKTIQLRSGAGKVSLTYNVDLFELDSTDRQFVLDLIDRMRKYEDNKQEASDQ